jgi:hypothetical protein
VALDGYARRRISWPRPRLSYVHALQQGVWSIHKKRTAGEDEENGGPWDPMLAGRAGRIALYLDPIFRPAPYLVPTGNSAGVLFTKREPLFKM